MSEIFHIQNYSGGLYISSNIQHFSRSKKNDAKTKFERRDKPSIVQYIKSFMLLMSCIWNLQHQYLCHILDYRKTKATALTPYFWKQKDLIWNLKNQRTDIKKWNKILKLSCITTFLLVYSHLLNINSVIIYSILFYFNC